MKHVRLLLLLVGLALSRSGFPAVPQLPSASLPAPAPQPNVIEIASELQRHPELISGPYHSLVADLAVDTAPPACRLSELRTALIDAATEVPFPTLHLPQDIHTSATRTNAILLRVVHQNSECTQTAFFVSRHDVEHMQEFTSAIPLQLHACREEFHLLTLAGLPTGPLTTRLRLLSADSSSEMCTLAIASQPYGRIRLSTIDAETSRFEPSMFRIVDLDTNQPVSPDLGIDLSQSMLDIANGPSGIGRPPMPPLNVPAIPMGSYDCLPQPSELTLPIGAYSLSIWHGPEWLPMQSNFTVVRDTITTVALPLRRWTHMAALGWWAGDVHIHARLAHNEDARRLTAWCRAADLNVCNILRMGNEARTFFEQRGYGAAYRVIEGNTALVPGQEDPRYLIGHALGLNITSPVRNTSDYANYEAVADTVHAQGGVFGHAHLARRNMSLGGEYALIILAESGKADFGEIMQYGRLGTELYDDYLNMGYRLTAAAGSDVPYGAALGEVRTYAYTGTPTLDVDKWFLALKAGSTFVTNGPMIDLVIDDQRPGAVLPRNARTSHTINLRAWAPPGATGLMSLRVIHCGTTLMESLTTAPLAELSIHRPLPPHLVGWIAAEARTLSGAVARTSPIYLPDDRGHTWHAPDAGRLLSDRLQTLHQLSIMVKRFEEARQRGTLQPGNHFASSVADQSSALLDRIATTSRSLQLRQAEWSRHVVPGTPR